MTTIVNIIVYAAMAITGLIAVVCFVTLGVMSVRDRRAKREAERNKRIAVYQLHTAAQREQDVHRMVAWCQEKIDAAVRANDARWIKRVLK